MTAQQSCGPLMPVPVSGVIMIAGGIPALRHLVTSPSIFIGVATWGTRISVGGGVVLTVSDSFASFARSADFSAPRVTAVRERRI